MVWWLDGEWMSAWVDDLVDGWIDGCTDCWLAGWMKDWMEGSFSTAHWKPRVIAVALCTVRMRV